MTNDDDSDDDDNNNNNIMIILVIEIIINIDSIIGSNMNNLNSVVELVYYLCKLWDFVNPLFLKF